MTGLRTEGDQGGGLTSWSLSRGLALSFRSWPTPHPLPSSPLREAESKTPREDVPVNTLIFPLPIKGPRHIAVFKFKGDSTVEVADGGPHAVGLGGRRWQEGACWGQA